MKKYQIIYADPPWSYGDKMAGHSFSLDHEYITQSKNWIADLQVGGVAEDNCCLFMWATSPLLPEALEVMKWDDDKAKSTVYDSIIFGWNDYPLITKPNDK